VSTFLAPGPLVRLDAALIDRIKRGERLGPIVVSAVLTIILGAGAYGAAFGAWRGVDQALYVAIKLPLLLFAITASTIGMSTISAVLLKSKLTMRQSAVAVLLALAITSAILGALAPISMFLIESAPPPDPVALGRSIDDPLVAPSLRVARGLLLWHVVVIACAGTLGVVRLRFLLARLIDDPVIARRVLWSWLLGLGLVGAELSWLLRPFMGKPHLPSGFLRQEALDGNFLQEVRTLLESAMGAHGPYYGGVLAVLAFGLLLHSLRSQRVTATAKIEEAGVMLSIASAHTFVVWADIHRVSTSGVDVIVERIEDVSLDRQRWTIECDTRGAATVLAERIERERDRVRAGPFRT
jgi:hypothetical protein